MAEAVAMEEATGVEGAVVDFAEVVVVVDLGVEEVFVVEVEEGFQVEAEGVDFVVAVAEEEVPFVEECRVAARIGEEADRFMGDLPVRVRFQEVEQSKEAPIRAAHSTA